MPLPSFRWLKIGVKAMCIGIMGLVLLSAHEAIDQIDYFFEESLKRTITWLPGVIKDKRGSGSNIKFEILYFLLSSSNHISVSSFTILYPTSTVLLPSCLRYIFEVFPFKSGVKR